MIAIFCCKEPGQRAAMGKDAEALYAAEAKERQGTRTDLMQNIEANLPQSQPEPKTRERAAKQAGKFKG